MMSQYHYPVNIGNPREMTIQEFGKEILKLIPTSSTLEFKSLPVDDPKVRQPDITRARTILDWEPQVDFEEGIARTIDYFKSKI